MKVLVTGASGHMGVNLVKALVDRGRRVKVLLHRHPFPLKGLDIEEFYGDVCDIYSIREACRDVEVVYHLAAVISITQAMDRDLEKVNVSGTKNVVTACAEAGVRRLVYFSSIHALDLDTDGTPVNEEWLRVRPGRSVSYDSSKAVGEEEALKGLTRGLEVIVIIPTGIIGPYDYQLSLFGEALITIAKGRLPVLIPGGFDWVDVRDVAEGAVRAEERAVSGSRYILAGHRVTVREIAEMVANICGNKVPGLTCPFWMVELAAFPVELVCRIRHKRALLTRDAVKCLKANFTVDFSRARTELDYQPRPFRETMEDTIEWYRQYGFL